MYKKELRRTRAMLSQAGPRVARDAAVNFELTSC